METHRLAHKIPPNPVQILKLAFPPFIPGTRLCLFSLLCNKTGPSTVQTSRDSAYDEKWE